MVVFHKTKQTQRTTRCHYHYHHHHHYYCYYFYGTKTQGPRELIRKYARGPYGLKNFTQNNVFAFF